VSGLGLEAQRASVLSYISHNGNELVAEYTEVESGKNDKRPKLTQALQKAKELDCTLCIARLDRLSRNVTFISKLMDSKVKFVCVDMPDATELTIHIFASLAQWERTRISERIKAALAAKRVREPGWKPGTDNLTKSDKAKAQRAIKSNARMDENTRKAYHFMKPLREAGQTYQAISDMLNAEGYYTRRGKLFNKMTVRLIWIRFLKEPMLIRTK